MYLFYQGGQENLFRPIWDHIFLTTQFICLKQKILSTLLFARIPIIFHEEILEPPDFCNSIAYFRLERIPMRYVKMFFISSFLCLSSWEKLGSPV